MPGGKADGGPLARAAGPLWALLGAAVCAWMSPLEPSLLEEGMIVQVAQRLVSGERLYRDVASFTGPLPFELLAALFRVFGEEIAVARGAVVASTGLTCAAVFGIARRADAGPLAHAAAACVASAPVLLFPLFSIYFYTTLAVQLGVLATYAAVRSSDSERWAVAAGALAAAAALCKQNVGIAVAAALLGALFASAEEGRRLRRAAALAAGGLGVAVVTLAWFALRGDLDVLVRSLVVLPLSLESSFHAPFVNFWPPGRFAPGILEKQAIYVPYLYDLLGEGPVQAGAAVTLGTQLLYVLPFLALAATAARRAWGALPAAIWLHAGALAAFTTNLFPRSDWGHLAFVLPAAAVQLLLLAPASRGGGRSVLRFWASTALVAGLAGAVLAAGGGLWRLAGPPSFGPRVPLRPVSPVYRTPAVPRVIHYLREHARPDEAIFVARAEPLLYFATDTRNPSPYSGVIPARRDEQERVLLSVLEEVRYVVMSDLDGATYTYYRDELPAVQAYLERHFRVAEPFASRPGAWIYVLERAPDRGPTLADLIEARPAARAWIRDARGRIRDAPAPPPRLATRHNRRPLPFRVGSGGGGLDYEVDVPAEAVLQADAGVGYATGEGRAFWPLPGARLAVSLGRPGDLERLAEVRLDARGAQGRSWIPIELDLSRWAGQRVALRLELVPGSRSRGGGIGWWGSPRIAGAGGAEEGR